jgi:subtilisin-like proprotein convertase family protein
MRNVWRSLAVLAALTFGASAVSAVPARVNYTGELMAQNGLPYSGNVDVTVRVYGQMSGGSPLVTEDLGTVTVQGGVLDAALDDLGAAVATSDTLWLEFEVDGEILSPRQMLSSVPFAHRAGNADSLGGQPASAFLTAQDGVTKSSLPTNGLSAVSNGALSNEFLGVDWNWGQGPKDIADFPGPAQLATITTSETGTSYITALTVYTQFSLIANSNIQLVLVPPPSTGIGAITLVGPANKLSSGTYAQVWTPGNTPALAPLLGTEVQGTWSLSILDTSDDLAGTAKVGTLDSFQISYDVVRSDEIKLAGDATITGNLVVQGTITAPGTERSGEVFTKWGSTTCPATTQKLYDGMTFVNQHTHSGSSDPVCMRPGDPGGTTSGDAGQGFDLLYTASLSNTGSTGMPGGNFGLKCAVCYQPQLAPCFVTWGTWACPTGFAETYDGYGYGSHYQHAAPMGRICVDKDDVDTSFSGNSAGWLYPMAMWSAGGTGGQSYPTQRAVKCAMCCRQSPF